MSMPSDLTTSGLLYEGNFDEWLPRMNAILSQQHDCAIDSQNGQPLSVSGNTDRKAIADTIWAQTSSYVRVRISSKSRGDPTKLIRALREAARPFRFMDLSPETRVQIYSFAIPSPTINCVSLAMDPGRFIRMKNLKKKDEVPVHCIAQQIRTEALPLFYKNRIFLIVWEKNDYPLNTFQQLSVTSRRERRVRRNPGELGIRITESIHAWASTLRPDTLKSLRHLMITVTPDTRDFLVVKLASINGRLQINCLDPGWLGQESISLLREHAATVSGVARSLQLEGEALMLFLTSRPEIWDRVRELQER